MVDLRYSFANTAKGLFLKRIGIGISDYKTIIEDEYYYIDKTLLIKELIEKAGHVALIPRPRRFGKTLNLSMLYYFFAKSEKSHVHLFENTLIWQEEKYRALQGKYPVIFLTFKNIKHESWEKTYDHFKDLVSQEYRRYAPLLLEKLPEYDKHDFLAIIHKTANETVYAKSLRFLTQLLYNHYQEKVVVLIDEYDTPIHAAFFHNFYKNCIGFMRNLLGELLKDNIYLQQSVLTGILMIAKEGIFSGLNNLDVISLNGRYIMDKFGFIHPEVTAMTSAYDLEPLAHTIQEWYDGYQFGTCKQIYNPWSVLKCVNNAGAIDTYWANTSDNLLIKRLLARASIATRSEIEDILEHKPVTKIISESVTLPDLDTNPQTLWGILLHTGYLSYTTCATVTEGTREYWLAIPNKEIRALFKQLITEIFMQSVPSQDVQKYLYALSTGNEADVQELLEGFVINHMSSWDLPEQESERSYHMFVLGLLVTLADRYHITSNTETGFGRCDIMLIPRDHSKPGILIEFKKIGAKGKESLEEMAEKALTQIKEKRYEQKLFSEGVSNIIAYGISFKGKQVLVKMDTLIKS